MRSVRLSMRANFGDLEFFWSITKSKVQLSFGVWAIESMGVAKTSFCHYAGHEDLENTLKQEATSSEKSWKGLLDMIVS